MSEILERLQSAIRDRYLVERELGRGGMATVYLATDLRHDRSVAIKVLHPDLSATIGSERFEREIKLAARLQHPHILGLHDSGEADGLLYYVMPFVQGESVRDRLNREHQLPVDEALQITLEVADALGYAHSQGIVHRDIKPENVLMSNGHALVADFGIARARTEAADQSRLTQTGMTLGTPVYMSPEQSTGAHVGPTADIYSLACMLFEMLAGEPPFTGPNSMSIMAKHAMEAVPGVRVVRPSVPEEVEEAILAAMEKSPADRPKSAAEFCEILGSPLGATTARRLTSRHTAARRLTPSARLAFRKAPWWRRPWVIVGGIGGVAAAALALMLVKGGSSFGAAVGGDLDENRVAVLYFDDLTPDSSLGYLADGLTEALIDQLKPVTAIDVLSKDAVSRFRGKHAPMDSVARVLEAGTLVNGGVSANGDRVRISISVIDGNSDAERARGFEVSQADLLTVPQVVVDSVSEYLREYLGAQLRTHELSAGTRNPRAWTLAQRAEKLRKDGVSAVAAGDSGKAAEDFAQADSLLVQAERADPKWVRPIALKSSLAFSRALSIRDPHQAAPVVEGGLASADRALQLDASSIDARETRGRLRYLRWQLQLDEKKEADALLEGAREDLVAVTRADRTRASAWVALSAVYSQLHEQHDSYLAAQRAYEEDAYLTGVENVLMQLFATSYDLERFPQAVDWCNKGADRFAANWQFVSCKLLLRLTNAVPADADSAWVELKTLEQLVPAGEKAFQMRRHRMYVAASLAKSGQQDSARRVLEGARGTPDVDPRSRLLTAEALVRTLLGTPADTAEAFRLLKAYVVSQPLHGKGFASTQHWWWRGLKNDTRWSAYLGGPPSS